MNRWTTRLLAGFAIVLAVGVVALAGLGGTQYWRHVETAGSEQTSNALPALATEQIPLIFGYDYQTVERSLDEASRLLTDSFKTEFESNAASRIIPEARNRQVVSQVNVVGAGMMAAQRNSGSVLVFMNRTVTDKSKQPVYDGSRLRVDYRKDHDGAWKIDGISPI